MNIYEKLLKVQSTLKAPKNQYNDFGKYYYRSCEDILEGLKPILAEVKAVVVLTDSIQQIGDRYYVKATATLIDVESNEKIETTAQAREDETKKGMDLAQITGSVSSYARKYALNGLFCIDDTKDGDATNKHEQEATESLNSDEKDRGNTNTRSAEKKPLNKPTQSQIKQLFQEGRKKEKEVEGYRFVDELKTMAATGVISSATPYGDKEGTIINWTVEDYEHIKEQLELPF